MEPRHWFGKIFLKQLGGLLLACGLFFGICAAGGAVIGKWIPSGELTQIAIFSTFSWPDYIVVAVGVGLGTYMLARSPHQKPLVASVAVAYELLLPLGAAGIGLTSGLPGLWLDGLLAFLVHLAWAVVVGLVLLLGFGLYPKNIFGKILTGAVIIIGIASVGVVSFDSRSISTVVSVTPTVTQVEKPSAVISMTPVKAIPTLTGTPQPTRTVNSTLTPRIQPSKTSTPSITPEPTTVWARVRAPQGDGAFVRDEPGGTILSSLLNGNEVEIVSAPQRDQDNQVWVQVRTTAGVVGWMMQELLATETPAPQW